MIDNRQQHELRSNFLYVALEKCKTIFWFVFWFSSATSLLLLFLPIYTSQVLDRVMSSGSMSTLIGLTVITLFAFLCGSILEVCRTFILIRVGEWLDRHVMGELVAKAISLTAIKSNTSTGEVIRDFNVIRSFITGSAIFSLFDTPWALMFLVVIFMIHPATGMIALVGIFLLIIMALWNDFSTKKIMLDANEQNVRNVNAIDFASRGAEVMEAMGMSERVIHGWCKKNQEMRALQITAQTRSGVIAGVTKFIRFSLQIAVIGVGAILAIKGVKTPGGIIAASILMGRALAPFEAAMATWKGLASAKVSYRRLQTLLVNAPKREQSTALPAPRGNLAFDRVFFTPYGSSRTTIKGVNFEVSPGDSLGIIGASASGKSTLAKLAVGVWKPVSGHVRLDGADVYTWNREDFGQYVGYLPQDVELFNATVKENIGRMLDFIDTDQIFKAAKIANIHELILSFPNGYDTVIGPGGIVLSGGQKQLIGLARAFYGNIKLLVLDEPNSSLDARGEQALIHSLKYAQSIGITVIAVTHKLSLLGAVNKVLVMQEGMVVAFGDRDEVMNRMQQQQQPKPATNAATSTGDQNSGDEEQKPG